MCRQRWSNGYVFQLITTTIEIYTLSLHDALPICGTRPPSPAPRVRIRRTGHRSPAREPSAPRACPTDRKSTRLNSSHTVNSYAVFCLKKKNQNITLTMQLKESGKQVPKELR